MPTLRMGGAVSRLPLYAFTAWTGTDAKDFVTNMTTNIDLYNVHFYD